MRMPLMSNVRQEAEGETRWEDEEGGRGGRAGGRVLVC